MKEVLSLLTLSEYCFVVFLILRRPNVVGAVPPSNRPIHCSSDASPARSGRRKSTHSSHRLPAADDESVTPALPANISPLQSGGRQIRSS